MPEAETVSDAAIFCRLIEENYTPDFKTQDFCKALGITEEDLDKSFLETYGASAAQYLLTRKLLLAKQLLAETNLSVSQISTYTGFNSADELSASFKKHYRGSPETFRGRNIDSSDDSITLSLGYRPPYAWNHLLDFLSGRAIPGVEMVKDNIYSRTVGVKSSDNIYSGWISVKNVPKSNTISVTLSSSLLPVLPKTIARIKSLFDLNCDPVKIYHHLCAKMGAQMCIEGLRLPGCFDPFEMTVRAILGQQITVKAATTLAKRLASTFGEAVNTPFEELSYVFPTSGVITNLQGPIEDKLGPLGVTGVRSRAILALANAIEQGFIKFTPDADPKTEPKKLLELPGFGPWTVQYVAMRVFDWSDAFPHSDYGVKKALPNLTPKEILAKSEDWKPWRAYATFNLWNSL